MPATKQNIVVVDDDEQMNLAIRRLLNAAGFLAVTFPSAEAFLEADAVSAACLVLDIHLPGISGLTLYRRLQQKGNTTPAVFITAYHDPDSQMRAEIAGAITYLTKPFSGQNLIAAIVKAIASRAPASAPDLISLSPKKT